MTFEGGKIVCVQTAIKEGQKSTKVMIVMMIMMIIIMKVFVMEMVMIIEYCDYNDNETVSSRRT